MDQARSLARLFQSRKLVALLLLGFSSGLPLYLTADTLQAWMTSAGVNLTTLGLIGLVGLPYSLKFLWSPLVDRFSWPALGRRRSWIVAMQLGLCGALAAMALADPRSGLELIAVLAVIIAVLSATQDIAFDAYRTDILEVPELGTGAAVGVLGYRIALLVTGALAFKLAGWRSWPEVYLAMAGLMLLLAGVTLWAPEPVGYEPPASLKDAVRLPLIEFFTRKGPGQALAVILFITLYKLGDTLAARMATPFLLKTGFSLGEIGDIKGGLGFVATTLGVLAGGTLLGRLGINRSLWVFGGLQAVSNLSYMLLALSGKHYGLLVATVAIENGCAGLGTAAFVAFLMNLCDARFSATQYALLSSLMTVGGILLGSSSGIIAERTGWPLFFALTAFAALPGLVLLPLFAPWSQPVRFKVDSPSI